MKKQLYFIVVVIMGLCFMTGCKKGTTLKLSDVTESTILLYGNGSIQGASVEAFDESYYDKNELKDFIKSDIETFNSKDGNEDAVKLNSYDVSNETAKVLLTYRDMDVYDAYNSSDIKSLTMDEAMNQGILPDTLTDAASGEKVSKEDVTKHTEYMIVTVSEVIDVKVEGTVKYYSNAMLLDEQTMQSEADKNAIIVYEKK